MSTSKKVTKKISAAVIAIILLLIFGVIFVLASKNINLPKTSSQNNEQSVQGASTETNINASLIAVKPPVSVERDGQNLDFTDEIEVKVGDKINTGEGAAAYLLFADNSSVTIDANTEIEIMAVTDNSDNFETKLFQSIGRTWMRVENLTGKKASFEVETPNTIAAVRGTQFGCDVFESKSIYYSIEHAIELTLKSTGQKFLIDQDKLITVNKDGKEEFSSFDDFKNNIKESWTPWSNFNKCVVNKAREVLGDNKIINFLKNKSFIQECLPELEKVSAKPNPQPQPAQKGPPNVINLSDNGNFTQGGITCNWGGENAKSYKVAIGTAQYGSDNVVSWQNTNNTNININPSLLYGQKYFCNVLAVRDDGAESGIYSTDGITFENGSVTPTSARNIGTVTITGTYTNMPAEDVMVEFSVQGKDRNGSVVSNESGSGTAISTGGNNFSFSAGNYQYARTITYTIDVTLKNKLSGRVLNSKQF